MKQEVSLFQQQSHGHASHSQYNIILGYNFDRIFQHSTEKTAYYKTMSGTSGMFAASVESYQMLVLMLETKIPDLISSCS